MYRADLNHDLIGHLLTDRNPGFLDSHDHIAVVYRYHCNVGTGYKSHGLQMTLYFLLPPIRMIDTTSPTLAIVKGIMITPLLSKFIPTSGRLLKARVCSMSC